MPSYDELVTGEGPEMTEEMILRAEGLSKSRPKPLPARPLTTERTLEERVEWLEQQLAAVLIEVLNLRDGPEEG